MKKSSKKTNSKDDNDIKTTPEPQTVFTENKHNELLKKLGVFSKKPKKYPENMETISNSPQLIESARSAVKSFLKAGYDFEIPNRKWNSGLMTLSLLKNVEENKGLSGSELIRKYVDNLSLDSCMSAVSLVSGTQTEKYEANIKEGEAANIGHLVDYNNQSLTYSYSDVKPNSINQKRPLLDTRLQTRDQNFEDMNKLAQANMIKAWEMKNDETKPFKKRIDNFINGVKKNNGLDVGHILEKNNVSEVWQEIKNIEKESLGANNKNKISRELFQVLGAEWSTSKSISDEEKTLRTTFNESEWLVNPFGPEYRQHKSGANQFEAPMPSRESIDFVKKEIDKGFDPFNNLEDKLRILGKKQLLHNPSDRFTFESIFSGKPMEAGISGTTTRMLNFWAEVLTKLDKEDKAQASNMHVMEKLCEAYLTEGKRHHSKLEVSTAARSRKINRKPKL